MSRRYDWAVVGAGPAGIAAVGKLLDHGVSDKHILWIDPEFEVGDFGRKWSGVPSNTKVGLFLEFLHDIQSFNFRSKQHQFELSEIDVEANCLLEIVVKPLQWVTQQLLKRVESKRDFVNALQLKDRLWHVTLSETTVQAQHVILAVGAEPREMDHLDKKQIDLATALNPQRLKEACQKVNRVAVFGSSHSAILAIRNVIEGKLAEVVNFYKSPLRYAVYFDDWTMYDDTGLKGTTATWAREHLDVTATPGIARYYSDETNIRNHLDGCDRVISAIGFERRHEIALTGYPAFSYDRRSGIIAPGLFGLGIAFPEMYTTPLGNIAQRVGLWKFLDYLKRVMPIWLSYHV